MKRFNKFLILTIETHILPHIPSEHTDRLQHPNTSEHIPKSPSITSQEGEEDEKFIHQTLGTEINESEYLLPNTSKNNTNKDKEVDIETRQDQDKDSITSFRTINSRIAPIGHSTQLPRQTNDAPTTTTKDYIDIIDDIGMEDSASQISITHLPSIQYITPKPLLNQSVRHRHIHYNNCLDFQISTERQGRLPNQQPRTKRQAHAENTHNTYIANYWQYTPHHQHYMTGLYILPITTDLTKTKTTET